MGHVCTCVSIKSAWCACECVYVCVTACVCVCVRVQVQECSYECVGVCVGVCVCVTYVGIQPTKNIPGVASCLCRRRGVVDELRP